MGFPIDPHSAEVKDIESFGLLGLKHSADSCKDVTESQPYRARESRRDCARRDSRPKLFLPSISVAGIKPYLYIIKLSLVFYFGTRIRSVLRKSECPVEVSDLASMHCRPWQGQDQLRDSC